MSQTANYASSFILRSIQYDQVWEAYWSGAFADRRLSESKSVVPRRQVTRLISDIGGSSEDPQFCFRDKFNAQVVMASSNSVHLLDLNGDERRETSCLCDWCRRPIREVYERHGLNLTKPLGVPLRVDFVGGESPTFYLDGRTCSCACALALIHENKKYMFQFRDPLYSDAEVILRHLHRVLGTRQTLKVAPDWRLYQGNGGALSDEDFDSAEYEYTRTTNVNLSQARVLYQRR